MLTAFSIHSQISENKTLVQVDLNDVRECLKLKERNTLLQSELIDRDILELHFRDLIYNLYTENDLLKQSNANKSKMFDNQQTIIESQKAIIGLTETRVKRAKQGRYLWGVVGITIGTIFTLFILK